MHHNVLLKVLSDDDDKDDENDNEKTKTKNEDFIVNI